ncbi:MAG: sensor domain-containing diguanylate cyclase, partial [Marinobacter sp.]|nr:sensor domain-containing diguanylate cyclase [Marinobacter sp.]
MCKDANAGSDQIVTNTTMVRVPVSSWRAGFLFIGVLLAMLLALTASADTSDNGTTVLSVDEIADRVDLRPYLRLLEDAQGQLSFDQVRARAEAGDFADLGGAAPNFGFTNATWWVRFTLRNPGDDPLRVTIRQDYPLIDHLDFWSPMKDGGWHLVSTGDRQPFAQRPLNNRQFLFPLEVSAHSEATYYLRFQTDGSLNIGLFAHTSADLFSLTAEEYLALGIYYGGFIVLLVYNLIMFRSLRERAFAYYALYVLSYGLYMSVHNGLSFQFLWPDNPWLANQSLIVLLALSLFGALRFTREILSTAVLCPRADRISFFMELSVLLVLLLGPFLSYRILIVPLALMTVVICAQMMLLCILTLIQGSGPARYYLAAFTALLGGVFTYMGKTFGLLPHNALTQNAFQVGSMIEMVLLSLAIGSRMNEIKQQNSRDALTRIYNRRYFNEQVHSEFQKTIRRSLPLSLMVIDIDHFKRFNDTFGHARGDQVLKVVAQTLFRSVRKPGSVYRYGGEEFVILLPGSEAVDVAVIAERIRKQIERETTDSHQITVSIGFATQVQDRFEDPESLFNAADDALYMAK